MTEIAPARVDAIVVPLDGSPFSERAVPVAVRLARRLRCRVHLFSAVGREDESPQRKQYLDGVAGGLEDVAIDEEVVVDGDPAGAIHEAIKRIGEAVACMSSHGRGRSAAVLGSVATEVLARGHDPLVLVGPLFDEEREGTGIFAAVDETKGSVPVLMAARRWASVMGERLTVTTVAEPVPPPVAAGPPRRRFGPDEDVDAFLQRVVRTYLGPDADVDTKAIYDPISPSVGLCTYLRDHPAWLVAVGSRARVGVERLVFGSVAAATVRCSLVPILVVPRPDTT